jgi:two-component system NtrC family sensor kinase
MLDRSTQSTVRIDPHEFYGRYRELQIYLGWTEADAERVKALAEIVEPHLPALIDDFYWQINKHPNARKVITGGREQVEKLKLSLRHWVQELLSGDYDRDYVHRRWLVGRKHAEIGLEQIYTNAALSRLRKGLTSALDEEWQGQSDELVAALQSLNMALDMDLTIIQDAYEDEYQGQKSPSRPR